MDRRKFIRRGGSLSLGFLGLKSYANICDDIGKTFDPYGDMLAPGYGPLRRDPLRLLNLPKGFSYKIISRRGNKMTDGFFVPGLADGMGTFKGGDGRTVIIRNHEVLPKDDLNGPFGKGSRLLKKLEPSQLFDYGRKEAPGLGGTTTMIYNHRTGFVEREWLSLAGTIRNCAGGTTPWGSWITCEETVMKAGDILEKDHGYNFEVPVTSKPKLIDPIPLKSMGRFNHEAVCVDPRTGIVYQTEDRPDSLIYRLIPHTPGRLELGGKLQVLAILGSASFDSRNWPSTGAAEMAIGQKYQTFWFDIDNVNAPEDDLRHRGFDMGAAVFARGEGMWFGDNEIYFACTNGGKKGYGQVFRYIPSIFEGEAAESKQPGTLELFIESVNSEILESCDNLTVAPNGDVIICEDKHTPKILGVTPNGKIFRIAKNVGHESEFAGACFSPDGQTLFVNIQTPGLTLAINGPWASRVEG